MILRKVGVLLSKKKSGSVHFFPQEEGKKKKKTGGQDQCASMLQKKHLLPLAHPATHLKVGVTQVWQ